MWIKSLIASSLMLAASSALALKPVLMPSYLQTNNNKPALRTMTIKLPIQGANYHWVFTNPDALYAGTLTLNIMHANQAFKQIVIFKNGKLNRYWHALALPPVNNVKGVYFEFVSTKKYATAPNDKIVLALQVKQPVSGIGPCLSGTLAVGRYLTRGIYSGLTDKPDLKKTPIGKMAKALSPKAKTAFLKMMNHRAFLETWYQQWPLTQVMQQGWLTGKQKQRFCHYPKFGT